MPQLTITDLVIEYSSGGFPVRPIDGLNLAARPGSLVLLLGPSGCGKTSLLSCLGGILTPKSGSIRVGDTEVTTLKGAALTEYRRNTVGIVFQAFNLVPSLTAVENVKVPMRSAKVPRRDATTRATALLDRVGLEDRLDHRPGDLSGGQQQRVAVARSLALDPPVLLADEPTAHLDYVQVEEVLRVLRELADGDRVVVVATHDQRLVPLADDVVELVPDQARTSRPPERIHAPAGQVVFEQGSWGELIYAVETGSVEIVARRTDGTEEVRATVGAGEYFGEIGPLYNMPRSATARVSADATLMAYTVRDFRGRLDQPAPPVPAAPNRRRRRPVAERA